jgi:glycosyltransferase involved in cell wall biosynthesis
MSLHVAVAGWLLGEPSGANRRLLALLRALGPLLQDDERVTVLHRPDFAPPPLPRIGWRAIAIPPGPTLARAFAERRQLPAALRALGADVLDHGFLPLPRVDVPVCLTVHDLRAVDGLSRWPRWLARRAFAGACARAAAVVAPSRWTAARLQQLAPRLSDVVVAPNAVDARAAAGALPRALPATGFVLHVGHVEPRKNLAVVVAALRALPNATRPELWLAGRDAGGLAAVQRAAGDVVVRAFGVVDEPTLAALYAHARSVVMPSRHEGFGLPVLEAFAHGAPVVASACAALPEVAGELATLLPPDDAAAWATALAATTRDDGEAASRRRAHAAAHDWTASARILLATWRGLPR